LEVSHSRNEERENENKNEKCIVSIFNIVSTKFPAQILFKN